MVGVYMKNLLVLLLLLAGHVDANEYKDFLRADKEERWEMVRKNGKHMSDYVFNIKYAFPERCNTLEEVSEYSLEKIRFTNVESAYFIPCGYDNPYYAKEAISVYEGVMVYNNDTAHMLYIYRSSSNVPLYGSTKPIHRDSIRRMTEQGREYSVTLFHDFSPNVKVY